MIQEFQEEIRGRSLTYYILSKCFSKPDEHFQQLATALGEIMRTLQLEPDFQNLPNEEQLKLELEYNRLFVGPGRLPCPPYESVHRKDTAEHEVGMVMGPSTRDALRRYAEAGFSVNPNFRDIPDHLQVELQFMYILCEKELEMAGEAELWQRRYDDFVKLHLTPWIPSFADCVERKTESPFYKSAARLLREFIAKEIEQIEVRADFAR